MTPTELNSIADEVPDSAKTKPGQTLYFIKSATGEENLHKIKEHYFEFGYTFDIKGRTGILTRIFASNQKNDIVTAWLTKDAQDKIEFPYLSQDERLSGAMWALRKASNEDGWKRYKEEFTDSKRQNSYSRILFAPQVQHIKELTSLDMFGGNGLPIPENPEIDQYRYDSLQRSDKRPGFYTGVSGLCNIYLFDKTFELLEGRLPDTYHLLNERYLEKFCLEVAMKSAEPDIIEGMLERLDLTYADLSDLFAEYKMEYPPKQFGETPGISVKPSPFKVAIDFVTGRHHEESNENKQFEITKY